ncbi:hypothetical protein SFC88_16730 [Nocardioides sp. HM23]|uniref:hypothetical protein n=1 Tax=Nocardioides bizhenqiangii TaxID=3095076 RepID=UPI002ACA4602|nr:hypothetical protein [Nocardioides sp. HM23]MDZ5622491.1 hypothetical protein [Nocardioides sp. HM23]
MRGIRLSMFMGLGTGLIVVGLIIALDLLAVDLAFVDDGALGAVLLVAGLLLLGLSLLYAPPHRRVMYVQSSRDDRTAR